MRGATWPQLLRLSTTSGHRPLQPQAFHNQRPQAIATQKRGSGGRIGKAKNLLRRLILPLEPWRWLAIRTAEAFWTSELIVVDEAAQTTKPMTLIPLQLAAADAHLILIGDHMQLAPTVLSKAAEWEGVGASMFERLIRTGGIH